jgi:hypothetical protein
MRDSGGPGIVGFELAGSEERAAEILGEWGEEGEDAARASLWIDYAYILSYGAFLTLAAIATRELALRSGWRRMASAGLAAIPLAAAGAFDAIEDVGPPRPRRARRGLAPLLAAVCAVLVCPPRPGDRHLLAGLLLRLRITVTPGANGIEAPTPELTGITADMLAPPAERLSPRDGSRLSC